MPRPYKRDRTMTPNDAFLLQLTESQRMLDMVMGDISANMLAWRPWDNVHPIGAIYAHAVGLEDMYVQQFIQGQPLVWASGQWAARLGRDLPPNQWNLHSLLPLDLSVFDEYKHAVFANSQAFVRGLSASDFERAIPFPGRNWSMNVAQLLATTIAHTTGHAGEIALLKGLQGAQGLPY